MPDPTIEELTAIRDELAKRLAEPAPQIPGAEQFIVLWRHDAEHLHQLTVVALNESRSGMGR